MNKFLLFLCFLCIPWAAQGQAAYDWIYWFDSDDAHKHVGVSSTHSFNIQAEADELTDGFHSFHVQVADTEGRFSPPRTQMFYHTGNREMKALRYWFDNDVEQVYQKLLTGGTLTLDVSALEPGLHYIYCQVEDKTGSMSDVTARPFYRQMRSDALLWTYWFDEEKETVTVSYPGEAVMLDVSGLSDGFHTIHSQMSEVSASDIVTSMFIKVPQTEGLVGDMTCLCTVDDELVAQQKVSAKGGVLNWQMDVNSVDVGLHKAMFQVVTPQGAASTIAERYFVRAITSDELDKMKCVYSLDNFKTSSVAGTLGNGLFHFDLDVSALEDGLHRLAYMMVSEQGVTTPQKTAFFWKTPLGGAGIVEYTYWLNDDGPRHSVKLSERKNPFSLISLLPVESMPLRSSCFHFAIKNGQPIIYAKNDFHIQFYDTSLKNLNETKQYVDEQVSQQVKPVGALKASQTFNRVAENGIRWYTVNVEKGDSLAFKSSQACTIQLFSPSGEEVYTASGSTSVTFDGCHAWEDGTHYLAVHDVTGSQSSMTLEYEHIDKYALLAWTPSEVGVAPSSFAMTLNGNGYDMLKSISLKKGSTTIAADTLTVQDKATAMALFSLEGTEHLGDYDICMQFEENGISTTMTKTKAIHLVEPIYGEIQIAMRDKSRMADPYPVIISVKNTGNVSYFLTPFYFAYDNADAIRSFQLNNFSIFLDKVDADNGVTLDRYTDNLKGTGKRGRIFSTFIPNIGPGETLDYEVAFSAPAHTKLNMYAWTGNSWSLYTTEEAKARDAYRAKRKAPLPSTACMPDPCDFIGDTDECPCAMILANAKMLANFYAALDMHLNMESIHSAGYDSYEDMRNQLGVEMDMFEQRRRLQSPNRIIRELLAHCGEDRIKRALSVLNDVEDMMSEDPCPDPPTHSIDITVPGDPNDIFGYTAESGSRYIRKGIEQVSYAIEFENDPEIADAAAHTIVVCDTLDSSVFDLSSLNTTSITLGDKIMSLDGEQNFVKTMDLRTAIDVVAQVKQEYNAQKGIVKWTISSLDPMSMEPTDDPMQGVLPVNSNGNGIGVIFFTIGLKNGLGDGKQIINKAGIVFDREATIMTPEWANTMDWVAPTSTLSGCEIVNDTTAILSFTSSDARSKVWKYDVYAQYGEDAPWRHVGYNVAVDSVFCVRIYEGINHGFYVVATDSAGNVEVKEAAREYTLDLFEPTEDSDLELALAKGWNWISHNLNADVDVAKVRTNALRILAQEEETAKDATLGFVGDLTLLKPTLGYKIQMQKAVDIPLDGKLFNSSFKSIGLSEGWNWIGYPLAHEMEIAQALEHFTPMSKDYIVGQDGFAQYADGEWTGTLTTLAPGKGYLYRSGGNRQMFFNATATLSSRVEAKARRVAEQNPWSCDKHKYPNVMPVTASLYRGGVSEDADAYHVAAFCGNECRGVGMAVKGVVMMNVYGEGDETITFKAIDKDTEQLLDVAESVPFCADVLGTLAEPYRLTLGESPTGIGDIADGSMTISPAVIRDRMTVAVGAERIDRLTIASTGGAVVGEWRKLADGSTVDVSGLSAGVYVVKAKAGKRVFTKKVMKVTE